MKKTHTGCSLKIVFFPLNFVIFLNSATSAAALVFYLPGVCTHTDNEGRPESGIFFKIRKKTQYLMNTLYISYNFFSINSTTIIHYSLVDRVKKPSIQSGLSFSISLKHFKTTNTYMYMHVWCHYTYIFWIIYINCINHLQYIYVICE